ncbi:MAG: hypothetical protein AAGJ32_05410 [Pseudomonadota bacterium]
MPFAEMSIELPCGGLDGTSEPEALYQAGLAYSLGEDVAMDLIAAHKWFNLAASKGVEEAKVLRQEIADQMSDGEIREAQKAAREWLKLMN